MSFKKFYDKQELDEQILNEFGGEGAFGKIGELLGKVISAPFNLMGAGIKAFAGGISNVMKSVVNKVRDPIKKKYDALLGLAEKVYPYDKDLYAKLKEEKSTLIREIDTYLALSDKTELPTKYSVGLDIVYKSYSMTLSEVIETSELQNPKLSVKTLEQASEVNNPRFPKMKDNREVQKYFDEKMKDPKSMLRKWIDTANIYCVWKNKYDKVDDEDSTTDIVTEINKSSMNRLDPKIINSYMMILEEKGEEVNIDNLEAFLKQSVDEKVAQIRNIIDSKETYVEIPKDVEIDQDFIAKLSKDNVRANNKTIANIYVSLEKLLKDNNILNNASTIFASPTAFMKFFVDNVKDKAIYKDIKTTDDSIRRNLAINFMALNTEKGFNNVKMNDKLTSNIDELFKIILPKQ